MFRKVLYFANLCFSPIPIFGKQLQNRSHFTNWVNFTCHINMNSQFGICNILIAGKTSVFQYGFNWFCEIMREMYITDCFCFSSRIIGIVSAVIIYLLKYLNKIYVHLFLYFEILANITLSTNLSPNSVIYRHEILLKMQLSFALYDVTRFLSKHMPISETSLFTMPSLRFVGVLPIAK